MLTKNIPNSSIHFATYDSPAGQITMLSSNDSLIGLYFPRQLGSLLNRDSWSERFDNFSPTMRWLDQYFDEAIEGQTPPLELRGTPFQVRVWNELLTIPFGATRTYGEVAAAIGKPTATRAVGKAIGDNPISLIVPCHRVIGRSGSLTGYAGGLETKKSLLSHEGVL